MLNYSIPAMKQVTSPSCYTAKTNRALYLENIPIGTKFHPISDRCFARHEPLGESKGLWLYNFHELEVVSKLKSANAYWYEVRLTENNVGSQTYWVYEHSVTPSKFIYNLVKVLDFYFKHESYIVLFFIFTLPFIAALSTLLQ